MFDQALSNFVKEESLAMSSTMLRQNLNFPSACVRSLRAKEKKALKRNYKNVQLFRAFLFSWFMFLFSQYSVCLTEIWLADGFWDMSYIAMP